MITGIELIEGPHDGMLLNLEAPVDIILMVGDCIYFQKDEDQPERYEYVTYTKVDLPPASRGRLRRT